MLIVLSTLLFLRPQPGKHVVFGRVVRGYDEVVRKISEVPVDEKDRPSVPVAITNCGELILRAQATETPLRGK